MVRPAPTLPVTVTAVTRGSAIALALCPRVRWAVMKASSGRPAARQASSSSSAQPTTFSAGFSRKALPPIRIGTAARIACQ